MSSKIPRLFCFLFFLTSFFACTEEQPSSASKTSSLNLSYGKALEIHSFASEYIPFKKVIFWLPETDFTVNSPIIYMHDGQMLFDSTSTWNKQEWKVDEALGELLKTYKGAPPIVVAMEHSKNRFIEYLPQKPFEVLSNIEQDSLMTLSANWSGLESWDTTVYSRFIVDEVHPFVLNEFNISKNAPVYVAGSSMGGLISMYALCEYPDFFDGAACLSTHWPGGRSNENLTMFNSLYDY